MKFKIKWTETHEIVINAKDKKEAEELWSEKDYNNQDVVEVIKYSIKKI